MVTRYLSGLVVAGLGLCGGGWLIVTALAVGAEGAAARRVNLATGAALVGISAVAAVAWAVVWRQRLRADGVLSAFLPPVSRREARRNRRQLARDVRDAARRARRAARKSRRTRPAADGPGLAGYQAAAHGLTGSPSAVDGGNGYQADGHTGSGYRASGYNGAGCDGASAADVLGELRTLLGPLLTAAGPGLVPGQHPAPHPAPHPYPHPYTLPWTQPQPQVPWPAPPWPAPPSSLPLPPPVQPPPEPGQAVGGPAGDDEVARLGDNEEAWW
jgi:hypothetical protein